MSAGIGASEHAGLMIKAGALRHIGRNADAEAVLKTALAMGRKADYVVTFPWSPTSLLQSVYSLALDAEIEVAYVRSVIHRLKVPAPAGASELWPCAVRVFALGRFEILVDDVSLDYGRKSPKRPLALLKFLIAHRGEASVEEAIDALWPDNEADAAANALDAALHRLRRLLGDAGRVALQDGQLRLDRGSIWVDAFDFEQALDAAEDGGVDSQRLTTQALRRYRGHFLAADRAEPWSISARERLRSRFIRTTAAHGRTLEAAREFEAAATHYSRAIDIDDLIEASYQGLMRAQIALGQRGEGIASYQRMRQTLTAKLGLQPAVASERLHEALRAL